MTRLLLVTAYQILFSSIIFLSGSVAAQNLVINGDFEGYNKCPNGLSAIDFSPTFTSFPYVQNWVRPTSGSSDFFHTCATNVAVGVPDNVFGYQQPHSGKGYVGFYGFVGTAATTPYQEFISTKLPARLKKDSSYCLSFYANAATSGAFASMRPISGNSVAAFISDTLPTNVPTPSMDPTRFIMNDTNVHLNDTSKWYKISGQYVARGGEEWITIGVFYDGNMPPFSDISGSTSTTFVNYVFVDDVSLTPSVTTVAARTLQYCGVPLTLTASTPAGPYRWTTGDTSRSITINAHGTYACTLPDECGNLRETFLILPVPIGDTVTERRETVCKTSGLDMKLTPSLSGSRYSWSTGDTVRELKIQTPGIYVCEVLRECRIHPLKFEITRGVPDAPVLRDTTICQYIDSPVLFTGYNDLVWFSANGAGPFAKQPTIRTREKGQIMLYGSRRKEDCLSERVPLVVTIKGSPRQDPPLPVLRCSDRPNELKIGLSTAPDDTYEWSTGETKFQIPLPAGDGQYTRTITNICGSAVDTFNIRSGICNDCLSFPNAFTPNADGLNDRFTNTRRCDITEYLFRVYNRWGEMLYVTSKPGESWDGTYRGVPAQLGTYFYQCTFKNLINDEKIRLQGDLLLIR